MFSQKASAQKSDSTQAAFRLDSADVKTIDGIVRAMYDVISGEPGPRNWERLRALCLPTAQFNAVFYTKEGRSKFFAGTVEKYITATTPVFLKEGFYEKESHRVTDMFGSMAHVFSTYESRHTKNGEVFERGINSIQLVYDKDRWWVVNVMWNSESEKNPLPKKYK
jgi:hypothetical protein